MQGEPWDRYRAAILDLLDACIDKLLDPDTPTAEVPVFRSQAHLYRTLVFDIPVRLYTESRTDLDRLRQNELEADAPTTDPSGMPLDEPDPWLNPQQPN